MSFVLLFWDRVLSSWLWTAYGAQAELKLQILISTSQVLRLQECFTMFNLCFSSSFPFMGCMYGVVWYGVCVCTHIWRPRVGIWSFLPPLFPLLFLTCNSLTSPGRPVSSRNPPGFASPALWLQVSITLSSFLCRHWAHICAWGASILPTWLLSQLLFSLHFPLLQKLEGICVCKAGSLVKRRPVQILFRKEQDCCGRIHLCHLFSGAERTSIFSGHSWVTMLMHENNTVSILAAEETSRKIYSIL